MKLQRNIFTRAGALETVLRREGSDERNEHRPETGSCGASFISVGCASVETPHTIQWECVCAAHRCQALRSDFYNNQLH